MFGFGMSGKRAEFEARIRSQALKGPLDEHSVNAMIKQAKDAGVLFRKDQIEQLAETARQEERDKKSKSRTDSKGAAKPKKRKRLLSPREAAEQRIERIKIAVTLVALILIAAGVVYAEYFD